MPLPINIETLINGQVVENERVEFKEGWNDEEIIHTITAFANDINHWNGGYIIIGIAENNGLPVLPPIGLQVNQIDTIQKKLIELCNQIQPYYFPIVEPTVFLEKHILILWCPGGDNRPYTSPTTLGVKGQRAYYVRHGSQTLKANQSETQRLIELAAKIPFDDRINHTATFDDLNVSLIQAFLHEVKSKLFDDIPKISFIELCKQMQIVKGSSEYQKPVNVGLLMFCEYPERFFKGAYIDLAIYKDNEGTEYTQKIFNGAIHNHLRDCLSFIRTNVIKERVKKVSYQPEALRFFNYPYMAIEEALANAVYHRSYELENQIEVHIFVDKIEIISYPGALPPVTNEDLKKDRIFARDYRNRRVGEFLKELHLTEAKGTGIPTIRKEMSKNGSPAPIFEMNEERSYFLTTLKIHKEFNKKSTEIEILKFCLHPKSRKDILELELGISNQTKNFTKNVMPLIEKGYLKQTVPEKPSSKQQSYFTTETGIKFIESEESIFNNSN